MKLSSRLRRVVTRVAARVFQRGASARAVGLGAIRSVDVAPRKGVQRHKKRRHAALRVAQSLKAWAGVRCGALPSSPARAEGNVTTIIPAVVEMGDVVCLEQ
ncbi:MAG: hypothetical protein U0232_03905 [Thermomicrobiales bacterium]